MLHLSKHCTAASHELVVKGIDDVGVRTQDRGRSDRFLVVLVSVAHTDVFGRPVYGLQRFELTDFDRPERPFFVLGKLLFIVLKVFSKTFNLLQLLFRINYLEFRFIVWARTVTFFSLLCHSFFPEVILLYFEISVVKNDHRFVIFAVLIVLVIFPQLKVDLFNIEIKFFVWNFLFVSFGNFLHVITFVRIVEKCAEFVLVAFAPTIAESALVLIWMVQSFNSRVAFAARKSERAHFPAVLLVAQIITIFRWVFEDLWGSPKVAHMVGVNAAFRVMRILVIWAPTRLILKHEKGETFQLLE